MGTDRDDRFNVEDLEVDAADDDLEGAMRDALEAVESSTRRGGQELDERTERGEEAEARAGGSAEDSEDDEMSMLRREVAELRDRSVRTLADFDNFRKRVERERKDQQRYAGAEILRDFLEVVDNLERALGSDGGEDDLRAGVELIVRQVHDLLRRHGVERIEAEGRAFDPSVHEAVSRQESIAVSIPTVRQELQTGYLMKDRLLRPSMVVVAVPVSSGDEDAGVQ